MAIARSAMGVRSQPQALIAILLLAIACGEHSVPTAAPRSVSFGRIMASDTTGCFELVPDGEASPRAMTGVAERPIPYEPPRRFELRLEGDAPPQAKARALTPDSNGVTVGWFVSSREELLIGWGSHIVVVRRYPDGALRAKLNGMIWRVQRRACRVEAH